MKPDQERLRTLLTDTVTLLCKNGLHFNKELKVEGLLGITLDDRDVFIVHINEKVTEQYATNRRCNSVDAGNTANSGTDPLNGNLLQQSSVEGVVESTASPKTTNSRYTRSPFSFKHRRKNQPFTHHLLKNKAFLLDATRKDSLLKHGTSKLYHSAIIDVDKMFVEEVDDVGHLVKREHNELTGDGRIDVPIMETLTVDSSDVASENENGLNLSVKDEKSKTAQDCRSECQQLKYEKNTELHLLSESDQNDNESYHSWFCHFLPSEVATDEPEGFPLHNNNNHLKGRQSDICISSVPQKVTSMPLVTDLIGSTRLKKSHSLGTRNTVPGQSEEPSTSVGPSCTNPVTQRQQQHLNSMVSYDQMISSETGIAALTSSGSVRRPRSARFKPFVCQVSGCLRMFFRGSELYRHQREKHGARHVRPRGASVTFL